VLFKKILRKVIMEETAKQQVTLKDVFKHYISSVIIYGAILGIVINAPVYYETVENEFLNYIYFFIIYYLGYVFIAPIIFISFKPKSVLESKNVAIIQYIIRQFKKNNSTKEFLQNIEPKENEKQALMTLFIKAFFGVNTVNILCNSYLPSLGYNFDFLGAMFTSFNEYIREGANFWVSLTQYIIDTGDMWVKMIITLTTLIFAFSYLTDLSIFKNKIKSADTTPLGVLSCIICYYPITILTSKFINLSPDTMIPVNSNIVSAILNVLIIIVNLLSLIAIIRLFGKSGNLTNRGIVTGFPYNIVRHPNYSMQILYIIITSIPVIFLQGYTIGEKISLWVAVLIWIYIYYIRSITEERHLIKDEKYREYVEKVKYRFIPKIF